MLLPCPPLAGHLVCPRPRQREKRLGDQPETPHYQMEGAWPQTSATGTPSPCHPMTQMTTTACQHHTAALPYLPPFLAAVKAGLAGFATRSVNMPLDLRLATRLASLSFWYVSIPISAIFFLYPHLVHLTCRHPKR